MGRKFWLFRASGQLQEGLLSAITDQGEIKSIFIRPPITRVLSVETGGQSGCIVCQGMNAHRQVYDLTKAFPKRLTMLRRVCAHVCRTPEPNGSTNLSLPAGGSGCTFVWGMGWGSALPGFLAPPPRIGGGVHLQRPPLQQITLQPPRPQGGGPAGVPVPIGVGVEGQERAPVNF